MIKVAIIGLDTSHSIEFPRLMQAPDCPKNKHIPGLKAISCLRFETSYQKKEGLDKRQQQLEQWGVKVTENIDEALAGCDAIMLEINDGSLHLEYFRKVAALGKPVFLDKPLAMSLADGRAIIELMRKHGTRVWSGSSVPFCPPLAKIMKNAGKIQRAHVFGGSGAPVGDPFIWYGVHTFEMFQRIMGRGAVKAHALETANCVVTTVEFKDGREGIVELTRKIGGIYGGTIWGTINEQTSATPFVLNTKFSYRDILRLIKAFFLGAQPPVDMETTFEGLAIMCAEHESIKRKEPVSIETL